MKNDRISRAVHGFTLLELMVALAIFSLIASVCYAALVPAGEGFRMLQAERDMLESSYQFDRRLRMDVSYMLRSADKALRPIEIAHDQRGADAFDILTLMTVDESSIAPVRVRYSLDEETGRIMRQSQMPWAREARSLDWQMQQAASFEVQALAADGRWLDVWDKSRGDSLPAALRVRWRVEGGFEQELILPVFIAGADGS